VGQVVPHDWLVGRRVALAQLRVGGEVVAQHQAHVVRQALRALPGPADPRLTATSRQPLRYSARSGDALARR